MRELIKNIIDHKNTNNPKVCFFLMELIKQYEADSVERLKEIEDSHFTPVREEKLSDEEILNRLYHDYDEDYDDYMNCTVDEKALLDKLNKEYLESNDIDTKYIKIIMIYTILDWDLVLPYHAYNYILEDKLK